MGYIPPDVTYPEELEGNILMQEPFFRRSHIEMAVNCSAKSCVNLLTLRFSFHQRVDLSGNPWELSWIGCRAHYPMG
jgi:hypothetical protein